jgi:hypothetical protein
MPESGLAVCAEVMPAWWRLACWQHAARLSHLPPAKQWHSSFAHIQLHVLCNNAGSSWSSAGEALEALRAEADQAELLRAWDCWCGLVSRGPAGGAGVEVYLVAGWVCILRWQRVPCWNARHSLTTEHDAGLGTAEHDAGLGTAEQTAWCC